MCIGKQEEHLVFFPTLIDMAPIQGKVVQLSTAQTHTILLTDTGLVYTCGGEALGNGKDGIYVHSPLLVLPSYFGNVPVKKVYASDHMSFALVQNSSVYFWGSFKAKNRMVYPTPLHVLTNITTMNAGRDHVVFITNEGHLQVFGYNSKGQVCAQISMWHEKLGVGSYEPHDDFVLVKLPDNQKAVNVSASVSHTLVLTEQGQLFFFGSETPPGDGTLFPRTSPKRIDTLAEGEKILWIESGTRTCFVRTAQALYSWGIKYA